MGGGSQLPVRVYVGLGGNLDGPVRRVREACEQLAGLRDTLMVACSPLYRNPPLDSSAQPDFVNGVVALETLAAPHRLLADLHGIEKAQGRVRKGKRWGARTLDLDLLLYGGEVIKDERLEVPHPGIADRSFVVFPLYTIAPELEVPGKGRLADMVSVLSDRHLIPVEKDW
ncbi:MAG: 2-amino-4-hydroxy-6-hydroxymethyldihydropteridine diphosphokinase [Gammaproteobacteria bacterium]|nr:2-amino-4-hydroxy-6-hydroxymethyldihydropteridine diphosphokinase [Gammaproteobacteria bacterium]